MSSADAPNIYLITDRTATGGRPLVDVVAAALRGVPKAARGRRALRVAVQLRELDLDGGPLFDLANELRAITRAAGAALYVNDRVDVALAAEADGVHLGERSLSIDDVRAIAPGLKIALSTHDRADVENAAARAASFVVFGPVFDTPSKRGILSPRGFEALADVARLPVPVLALGGIDAGNGRACVGAGVMGLACIRHVMSATDPTAATSALASCFVRVSARA